MSLIGARVRAALLAAVVFGFAWTASGSPSQAADEPAKWLTALNAGFEKCGFADKEFSVAVVPEPGSSQSLLEEQIEFLRANIQGQLTALKGLRIKAIEELATLRDFSTLEPKSDDDVRRLLKTQQAVNALVIFKPFLEFKPGSTKNRILVSLKLMSVDEACLGSAQGEFVMPPRKVTRLDVAIGAFATDLVQSKPDALFVVGEFRGEKGIASGCDRALRETTIAILSRTCGGQLTAQTCPKIMTEDTTASESDAKFPRITVSGEYGVDRAQSGSDERPWIRLSAKDAKGLVIGRATTRTYVDELGCDPTPTVLMAEINALAPTDSGRLLIQSPQEGFQNGGPFRLKIYSKTAEPLYCWYVYQDRTAFILTPAPNSQPDKQASLAQNRTRYFPDDFDLQQQTITAPADDVFQCFFPRSDITSTDLHREWIDRQGPKGSSPNKALLESEWRPLVDKMRLLPGVVGSAVPIKLK